MAEGFATVLTQKSPSIRPLRPSDQMQQQETFIMKYVPSRICCKCIDLAAASGNFGSGCSSHCKCLCHFEPLMDLKGSLAGSVHKLLHEDVHSAPMPAIATPLEDLLRLLPRQSKSNCQKALLAECTERAFLSKLAGLSKLPHPLLGWLISFCLDAANLPDGRREARDLHAMPIPRFWPSCQPRCQPGRVHAHAVTNTRLLLQLSRPAALGKCRGCKQSQEER